VEELEKLGTAVDSSSLQLLQAAYETLVKANKVPMFVVQEISDDDGQVVIGLYPEQPVPRSSVCRAKHMTAWVFIILISFCMQLMELIRHILIEYYLLLWQEPLFIGGGTLVVIPSLFLLRRWYSNHEAKKKRALDIVSIREEVVLRLQRLAEQGADSVVVDSQALRDDIMWNRYSMSRALRTRMERDLWPHVVSDIDTDQRIEATRRVLNGQRRIFWAWRSNMIINNNMPGGSPPAGQAQHHVRFRQ
jgi:hypothetical protein